MRLLTIYARYWVGVGLAYLNYMAPTRLKRFIGTAEQKEIDKLAAVATEHEKAQLLQAKGEGFTAVKRRLLQKYGIGHENK